MRKFVYFIAFVFAVGMIAWSAPAKAEGSFADRFSEKEKGESGKVHGGKGEIRNRE